MQVEQKANYLLWLNFDKYTGNFERELIGYIMGYIDSEQEKYCDDSYGSKGPWTAKYREDIGRDFYTAMEYWDEWIQDTYQSVDDWEQMTFYNIEHRHGECNSIYIQFYKEPSEEIIKELLARIAKWENEFHVIKNAGYNKIYMMSGIDMKDTIKRKDTPTLLSAELEDTKANTSKYLYKK